MHLGTAKNRGTALDDGTLHCIVRWGGWQAVTGVQTVMRIYARKVIDDFIDPYAMSLGRPLSDKEWERRRVEYIGEVVSPSDSIVDYRRGPENLQVRLHVWEHPVWQRVQRELNEVWGQVMQAALADMRSKHLHRYLQNSRAFSLYCDTHADNKTVILYKELVDMRGPAWSICMGAAMCACENEFKSAANAAGLVLDRYFIPHRKYLQFLRPVVIGAVDACGRVHWPAVDCPEPSKFSFMAL